MLTGVAQRVRLSTSKMGISSLSIARGNVRTKGREGPSS